MDKPVLTPPLLFLSDVHLGAFSDKENRRLESDLIQLINYCQRNNIRIAVLGDLFDYWMEYPNKVPNLGKRLLDRFEEFNRSLGPALFITGNHDNWTRDHLPQRGFYLEHEYYMFTEHGKKFMALHGDGLSDPEYNLQRPLMHRIIRNEYFVRIYQTLLPQSAGISLMSFFSQLNRSLFGDSQPEKLNLWSKNELEDSDLDVILCGHDHIPRTKHFSFGTYINLGSFYEHRTMALYNKNDISLVLWKRKTQSLEELRTNT